MKKLFIIAGPNGAGKTTASYTILPEILDCKEFVNADEIAKGLSPFQPEKVAIDAGRIMLQRIKSLMESDENFAFETTLSSKIFVKLIQEAKQKGYDVTLLFLYLDSPEMAVSRVKTRVEEGGHDIPEDTIIRRYYAGLRNLFQLYLPLIDNWMIIDNSLRTYKFIAEMDSSKFEVIENELWNNLTNTYGYK